MPVANRDGWIRHRGGKCPVPPGTKVEVRYRGGDKRVFRGPGAGKVKWGHLNDNMDIMAYRIVQEAKPQFEVVKFRGVDVDWNKAPEGTTHIILKGERVLWRKVENGKVFMMTNENGWVEFNAPPAQWLKYSDRIILPHPNYKPEVAKAALNPNVVMFKGVEVDWRKAPAGATHALMQDGKVWWRRVAGNKVSFHENGVWKDIHITAKQWLAQHAPRLVAHKDFVFNPEEAQPAPIPAAPPAPKVEAAPKPPVEPVVKKKDKVGWW